MKKNIIFCLTAIIIIFSTCVLSGCSMKNYNVSFDLNGGNGSAETQTVRNEKTADRPANPTKIGYSFAGWSKQKGAFIEFDFNEKIQSDMILYAYWKSPSSVFVTVTLDNNGGSGNTKTMKMEDGSIFLSSVCEPPSKNGSVFAGWTTKRNDASSLAKVINENITLYALWIDATSDCGVLLNAFKKTMEKLSGYSVEASDELVNSRASYLVSNSVITEAESFVEYSDGRFIASSAYSNGIYYHIRDELYEKYTAPITETNFGISQRMLDYEKFKEEYLEALLKGQIQKTNDNNRYTVQGVSNYEFILKDGYVDKISLNEASQAKITKFYMVEQPFEIKSPVLSSGKQWTELYTVTLILPDGLNEIKLYGKDKIYFDDYEHLLPIDYKFSGTFIRYSDGYDWVRDGTEVEEDTTFYVLGDKITGAAGELLLAIDATSKMKNYQLIEKYSNGDIKEVWNYSFNSFWEIQCREGYYNGSYYGETGKSERWFFWDERESYNIYGTQYILKDGEKTKKSNSEYYINMIDDVLRSYDRWVKDHAADVVKNGDIYTVKNSDVTFEIKNGIIVRMILSGHSEYIVNRGESQMPPLPEGNWLQA